MKIGINTWFLGCGPTDLFLWFVMASIVKINAGGVHFETTPQTLTPSSYFRSYLERWNNGAEKETELFVDRSGVLFEHVLSKLRNPDYRYPSDNQKEIENYRDELGYYGIKFTEESDGMTCELCDNMVYACHVCSTKVCKGCSTDCTSCDHRICSLCKEEAEYCDSCHKIICSSCVRPCVGYTYNLLSGLIMDGSTDPLFNKHQPCEKKRMLCKDCGNRCDNCSESYDYIQSGRY